jgi:hypothetical protein
MRGALSFTMSAAPQQAPHAQIRPAVRALPAAHVLTIKASIARADATSFFIRGECARKFGSSANKPVAKTAAAAAAGASAPPARAIRQTNAASSAPIPTAAASIIARNLRIKTVASLAGV